MDFASAQTFLRGLAANNNREWFEDHRDEFQQIKADFEELVGELLLHLSKTDSRYGSVLPKECVFRLYRDLRFSKDKTPYKPHLGAFLSPQGKSSDGTGCYFHLEAGDKSMIAGGLYQPKPAELRRIRDTVQQDSTELRKILKSAAFKKRFTGLTGERSTRVAGVPSDHPDFELISHKQWIAHATFPDTEAFNPAFVKQLKGACDALMPLNQYLDRIRAEADAAAF